MLEEIDIFSKIDHILNVANLKDDLMKRAWLWAGIVLFIFVAGCSSAPGTYMTKSDLKSYYDVQGRLLRTQIIPIDPSLSKADLSVPAVYSIEPFDVLNIIVWDHPELSAPNASSMASVETNAVTANQNTMVAAAVNPNQVGGFEVNESGEIYFPYAGAVKVVGRTPEQAQKILAERLSKYFRHPQVTIQVNYLSKRIHLIGEVVKPGDVELTAKPISMMEALDMVGGVNTQTSDTTQIYLVRGNLQSFKVYVINGKNPMSLIAAEHFYVMPNDIIYAAPSGATTWNKVLGQIWPTIQAVWFTKSILDY